MLWASMLLSLTAYYAMAALFLDSIATAIAEGSPTVTWDGATPWTVWLAAAILAAASIVLPRMLDRRAIARLRGRVTHVLDPARPGSYRTPPDTVPQLSDALIRAAGARYAGRLALSFALLACVALPSVVGVHPVISYGMSFCRYFWRPVDYLPMVVPALTLALAQWPTRRRMLRLLVP